MMLVALLLTSQGTFAWNWTAGKTIYFDNTDTQFSPIYCRIGRESWNNDWTTANTMTKVTGTANLYKYTQSSQWSDYSAFGVGNNSGWTNGNTPYKTCTGDTYKITKHTQWINQDVTSDITVVGGSSCSQGTESGKNDCTCFYSRTIYSSKKTWSASITAPSNGTIKVSYKDENNTSQSFTSGSKSVLPTCTITVTATPSAGYKLKTLTVGGASISSGGTYNVRSDVSIVATFECDNPSVITADAIGVGANSATVGGSYTGGSPTAVGITWTKTKSGDEQIAASGTTPFSKKITGLSENTNYKYQAYAVACGSKVYGLETSFTTGCTPTTPTVTTSSTISNITNSTVTLKGNVTSAGVTSSCAAQSVTDRGIVWTSSDGTITGSTVSATTKTGIGEFTVNATGLSGNTKYYFKAYATNGAGTNYGSVQSFTTAPGSIYVRGPIMGDNGDGAADKCWDNTSYYEMQNNGSNVFTKTFNPSGNYCDYGPKEFVLTMENNDNHKLNPDWFGSKTGCQKSSRQGQDNNFESTLKYSNADQLTLTVTWNGNEDYSISLVKTNNQPTDLYIKGPLVDSNWDGGYKQPGYTKNGDTYVFTFEAKTGGDAREFCISSTQGDKGKIHYTTTKGTYAGWDFKDTQEGKNFVASDQIVTRDNFPIKVTVTYVGGADYDFTLDIESNGCEKPTLSLAMPYNTGKTYNQITANAQITATGTCTISEFGVEAFSDAGCTQRVSYTTGSTSSTSVQPLAVTELTANTKYWFRAYAKTDDGDTYSSVVTDFTRVNAEKMSATNITSSSATLQGKALTDGGFATELKSNAVFKYGTTNVVADATSVTSSSKAIGSVITYDLSGLAAGTTYYYWFCPTTTDGSHPTTPNYSMNSFTTNRVHSDIVLDNQSVCVGADITLKPTCSTATNGFTYSSDNTSVATVDDNGVVHGVAAGTATITVTTEEVSGYDVKTKDITVTVSANAFTIVVSPDSPLAYQVVTLSASNGESTTWTKASSDAYFVGADGLVINGDETTAESIKLKAKSGAYTISATQSVGTCAYNTREITVSTDTENCSGN